MSEHDQHNNNNNTTTQSSTHESPSNPLYISSQLRALLHLQHFLTQQLQQASQEIDGEDDDAERGNRNNVELESISVQSYNINDNTNNNNVDEEGDPDSSILHNNNNNNNEEEHNNSTSNTDNNRNVADEADISSVDARLDLQMISKWVEQAIPFLVLLVVLWIYQHRNSMCVLLSYLLFTGQGGLRIKHTKSFITLSKYKWPTCPHPPPPHPPHFPHLFRQKISYISPF